MQRSSDVPANVDFTFQELERNMQEAKEPRTVTTYNKARGQSQMVEQQKDASRVKTVVISNKPEKTRSKAGVAALELNARKFR